MKESLRVPLEATEPDLVGPRLVHETGGDDRQALPGFCAELREARLRGGYSLSDAAHVLRIQEHYLEALEEGRFDQIPGTTYIIGFLRSYSGFLGLDPDEIIDAFKREQGLGTKEPRLAFPSPSDSSPKPKFWLILLVLVLAGLAYGGWQYQSTGGQIATDLVDDVSTKLTEAVGLSETDATGGGVTGGDAAPETAAAQPAAEATPEPPAETATAPVAAEVTTAAPSEPEPSASGQVEPAPAAPRQEEPARAEPAPADPAATDVADANLIPAAEVWDEAAPSEPSVASAENSDPSPAIAVPLDFVVAEVGGTDSTISSADEAVAGDVTQPSGTTDSVDVARADAAGTDAAATDTVDEAASAPAATEPMADVPPEETAPPSTTTEEPSLPSADAGYVPKVYGRTNFDSRVVITAVDDSWVQVQGPDNELLLTRILHAGDSYRVPDRPGLVMVTGNAGGLEVKVDDAVAPALGPLGVVMRNIALDPDRLLSGTATGG